MLRARPTAKAEVLSLEDGQEEPPVALIEVEEEPPAEQSFLWEQIASSLDEVELHEVRRVVGEVLVQSLEDVYAEVRALADILDEYSAATNDLVSRADEQRQVLGSPAGGLLQQELRHLVRHLGSISAARGAPADALLPPMDTKQRRSLDALLRADGEHSRPRTASSVGSRESVRHLRRVGHASEGRPRLAGKATAEGPLSACQKLGARAHAPASTWLSLPPRPGAEPRPPRTRGWSSVRPPPPPATTRPFNGRSVGCSRPGTASRPSTASRPGTGVSGGGGGGGGSRPQTSGSAGSSQGRPQTNDSVGRPTTGASTGSTSNAESGGGGGGGGGVVAEAVAGGRGGAVIAQLRAALEEERRALLVQAEQLRLSLDDECDYREESAVPPPSVPEMTQLKLALQESLARAEHEASAPALRASLGSRDHERRALNRLKPLPPSEPKPRAPSARDRLRGMVDEAREPGW